MPPGSEVLIMGAGVIGLSLALELRLRGHRVAVLECGTPLAQASTAAAGMLAVEDPHNPPDMLPLARLSGSLYAAFLARVEALSGLSVPFQTEATVQTMPDGTTHRQAERSIDPRQLAPALLLAARHAGVYVAEMYAPGVMGDQHSSGRTPAAVVHTTGAWGKSGLPVSPRKGQMLRVHLEPHLLPQEVFRNEDVYVVPRTRGPQRGTALIGATIEDAGFDTSTTPGALAGLRERAAELVPAVRDEARAPAVEAWAGLRPATPDLLPILGPLEAESKHASREYVATGHFRNGILLAPATALVMADLIEGRDTAISLAAFSPARFTRSEMAIPFSLGRK